jgi:hypothetical protein
VVDIAADVVVVVVVVVLVVVLLVVVVGGGVAAAVPSVRGAGFDGSFLVGVRMREDGEGSSPQHWGQGG